MQKLAIVLAVESPQVPVRTAVCGTVLAAMSHRNALSIGLLPRCPGPMRFFDGLDKLDVLLQPWNFLRPVEASVWKLQDSGTLKLVVSGSWQLFERKRVLGSERWDFDAKGHGVVLAVEHCF